VADASTTTNDLPAAASTATSPSDASNGTPRPPVEASTTPNGPTAAQPIPTKRAESSITPATTEYKRQIEQAIADKDLKGRVKLNASANTLTLVGKLRPAEHASLLKFMRNAPGNVHVVDDIQYDDTPVASAEPTDNGAHPVPAPGYSAIHIVTDVIGAKATLFGPAGRHLFDCQTPCSFNNLSPARYSLQVQKDGYSPLQTAVELHAGQAQDQKLHLEAIAKGLFVSTQPAGAEIFINGAKQSGPTPATIPLASGQYDLVLRMPGYNAYSEHIQVNDNGQTVREVQLKERTEAQQSHVAWAKVDSIPEGAEILVDGTSTGQVCPARVQIPSGDHIIALRLGGFQVARRLVQASVGSTVAVTAKLNAK
jgi:hypothetical protein